MNPLLEQLHAIDGIDSVSNWPLAIGWQIIIAVSIVIVILFAVVFAYWLTYKRSWKNTSMKKLVALENNLNEANTRQTIMILSEYLRRIALKRYPREECAGLTDDAWLQWLTEHDPKNFNWKQKGGFLVNIPYAPLGKYIPCHHVKEILQAAKHWIR